MKKTALNIFYSCATQLLAIIVPLITSPYISRVLLPNNLGIYTYIDSVSQIICVLGSIGLTNYGIREIAYAKNDKNKRSIIFFEIMIIRFVMLVISYAFYCLFMKGTQYEIYSLYQIIWFIGSFLDIIWLFNGMEDFKTVVIRNLIVKVVTVILIFSLVKAPSDLVKYILLIGACQVLATVLCYKNIKSIICLPDFHELHPTRHLLPTLKIALPQAVTLIYYQMDKVMLEYLLNEPSILAYYDLADKIVKIPVTAITAVSTVMLPKSSKYFIGDDSEGLTNSIQSTIDFSILLIFPMCLGLMSIANGFVPWFYGDNYLPVSSIIISLCPVIIARGLSSISSDQYLVPTKNTKYLTISSVFSAVINVIVNYITIPIMGVYGAVLGTIVAEFSVTTIQFHYMRKQISIKGMTKNILKYSIFSIICCSVSILIWFALGNHIYTTVSQMIAAIIVYLVLLLITKDRLVFQIIKSRHILKGNE